MEIIWCTTYLFQYCQYSGYSNYWYGRVLHRQTTKMDKMCLGGDTLSITSGVDRVYTHPTKQICISNPQNQRTISVENQGDTAAVIWNPWELAQGMLDMKDDSYTNMVCVESTLYAETLEGGHTLLPGESYKLSTKISLKA